MKRIKKVIALVLTLVMGMALMVGCGDKKTTSLTPEESIKILMDANIFAKKDEISKVGITDAQFDILTKTKNTAFKKSFMTSSKMKEGVIPDAQLDSFTSTVFEALGKSDIQIGTAKVDGKKATLDITIKGLDMNQVINNTVTDVTNVLTSNPNIKEEEYMVKFMESYEKNIKAAPLVATGKTVNITMTQKDGYWDVDSNSEIEKLMGTLLTF
ncbi:MAG: DUF5105 domain-containing protein [Clostridium sp.]